MKHLRQAVQTAARLLSPLLIVTLSSGCSYTSEVSKRVIRGTPQHAEVPRDANAPFGTNITATTDTVDVQLLPTQCVTKTSTPTTTVEVTTKKLKTGSALVFVGLGVATAALGTYSWVSAKDNPSECAEGDEGCVSKSGAQIAGAALWGLGGVSAGYGTYKLIDSGSETETNRAEGVEDTLSSPHACKTGLGGVPVAVRLPGDHEVSALTDASGRAQLRFADAVLEGLTRRSAGQVFVVGTGVGSVALEPLIAAYQRRLGIEPGVLTSSSVVAASGRLSPASVQIEVSVSPQDGAGEFLGSGLSVANFALRDVVAVPARGGTSVPLPVEVARIDASGRQTSGSATVLLFDSSGSMSQNDPGAQSRVGAATAFIDETQGSIDVAVLDFGAGSTTGMRASRVLQSFTRDSGLLQEALGRLRSSGGTPLYPAINDALSLLEESQRAGAVILLTDGQARGAHDQTIDRAKSLGIPIYSVGLGNNLDFNALRSLGMETGGFFVEAAERDKLASAFQGVGTGVSVGKVRIFAKGAGAEGLQPGAYLVSGKTVTTDSTNATQIERPFQFNTIVGR